MNALNGCHFLADATFLANYISGQIALPIKPAINQYQTKYLKIQLLL